MLMRLLGPRRGQFAAGMTRLQVKIEAMLRRMIQEEQSLSVY